jgi:hypothetical protein
MVAARPGGAFCATNLFVELGRKNVQDVLHKSPSLRRMDPLEIGPEWRMIAPDMAKPPSQPPLTLVSPGTVGIAPPRPLGSHGMELWNAVQREYNIQDRGGIELLCQACAALERAEALAEAITAEGVIIHSRAGVPKAHPACRDELAARQFVCRTLERLGVTVEPIKSPGRQPSYSSYIPPGLR